MLAILKKEINSFFASPIGYLVIGIFLLLNGLFLWIFKGDFNILDYGFADLSSFFLLAPWILIFLIPAVTMRNFSDEKKQGTLELLLTKPITHTKIVLGKYFGAFVLILIALLPTLLYVYTVYQLGNPVGNLDVGSTLGSYFGLLFLVASYTAIGVFCSTLSDNQIVAFISAVFLCFLFYIGFEGISEITSNLFIEQLGMSYHFKSMGRGVLDTGNILYFLSITLLFIVLTIQNISTKPYSKKEFLALLILPVGLLVVNIFSSSIHKRFDLTEDKRYTLSETSKELIEGVDSPIIVDVFLKGDDFPSEFKRLQRETKQLLEEFRAENSNVNFNFINPLEKDNNIEHNIQQLTQRGMPPRELEKKGNTKISKQIVFPWALASYNNQTIAISLLKNQIGFSSEENAINSIQNLEYAFADGFSKLTKPKHKKIAFLIGNNELKGRYTESFRKVLSEHYLLAPFTLDSVVADAQKTLNDLNQFDLIISAKPTEAFTEEEKLVLDQYVMNGGKSLWLIDAVAIEKDSLYNNAGKNFAVSRDLNLTDFFFKYGVRINPSIVADLYSAPIMVVTGQDNDTRLTRQNWPYSPLADGNPYHPITKSLNRVKFDFANQIDTLKNNIEKTVLLRSSALTKLEGTPREISLETATKKPDRALFNKGNQILAVLLEGEFNSVYKTLIKPVKLNNNKDQSIPTKMIVVADGDVIKNQVDRNGPTDLAFDRSYGKEVGNKEFLLNTVNYLLDDNGLINIRSKEIPVAFLNQQKVVSQKTKWQLVNILLPLLLLALFGFAFNYLRKKKYAT